MANVLNSIKINQSVKPAKQAVLPSFTFDTEGRIKPLKDEAKLLPSRIFGSPIEYAKDLKKDVVNIGRAAKGKANDHELGRINDLALKTGSLALATYLCIKNPLKLSKAMEFVGLGTFFGSMALWPKLAIQAPIKARTGVDIHQKYIDSEGRKKMLYLDPQYDLTDLYSREDLDRMGKKLGVSENLPDRDRYIKQRAKKTAVQGNTLWMMTAGVAPVLSALTAHAAEEPLNKIINNASMELSKKALDKGKSASVDMIQKKADKVFEKFLKKNADNPVNEKMADELAKKIGSGLSAHPSVVKAIKQEIIDNSKKGSLTVGDMQLTLESLNTSLNGLNKDIRILDKFIASGVGDESYKARQWNDTMNALLKKFGFSLKELKKLSNSNTKVEDKLADIVKDDNKYSEVIKGLLSSINDYENKVGHDKADGTIVKKVVDEISTISNNANKKVENEFSKLAGKLATGKTDNGALENSVVENVKMKAKGHISSQYRMLQTLDFFKRAEVTNEKGEKILENEIIDLLKKKYEFMEPVGAPKFWTPTTDTTTYFNKVSEEEVKAEAQKLIQKCKSILLDATITDHTEKFSSANYGLTDREYLIVSEVLYGANSGSTIDNALNHKPTYTGKFATVKTKLAAVKDWFKNKDWFKKLFPKKTTQNPSLADFEAYKKEFNESVINWKNGLNPALERRFWTENANSTNPTLRANLVGNPSGKTIADAAKKMYNTKMWLRVAGITAAVITGVTLIAGFAIGRKGEMEKKAEEKEGKKING